MVKEMFTVDIIGCGFSADDLTENHKRTIKNADFLAGGKRYLDFFRETRAEKLPITNNISLVAAEVKRAMATKKVVVLASGDPLFFGIGATLVKTIGREHLRIHPNISSLQAAFAAIKQPWHDAGIVSLHGRKTDLCFKTLLKGKNRVALLTDPKTPPGWIAERLLEQKVSGITMSVLENLRTPHERITLGKPLETIAGESFSSPNIVILETDREQPRPSRAGTEPDSVACDPKRAAVFPGMPEHCFVHENGLITKAEVRAVVFSKLRLVSEAHTFWDLGAGSGAVSIEVSKFIPRGSVTAVEKKQERIADIRKNIHRFGAANIETVHAHLPGGIEGLETPDRVFIGGGGRDLVAIMDVCCTRMADKGIMVINTVLLQNIAPALELLQSKGFETDLVQVQVAVSRSMPFGDRLAPLNPVWILSGRKNGDGCSGQQIE
ncbi:MAG TPA: precorrin-6y C5,15-methyltransferase (decarboxylating) subunit CbiE [Desulfobacteraceae bacterium]|nr:precorrin-6y C5,15-methyltransferase (decarboxylating) subunit CbiE [Desulfobacteraceae bacterium]